MEPGRFQNLKDILSAALDLPAAERDAFVLRRSGEDAEMLAEARSLLARDAALRATPLTMDVAARVGRAAVRLSDAATVLPETIGPYRILSLLGKGGMGTVYRAEQPEPIQREVALKVIRQGFGGANAVARFESERQTLAVMDHPNIAKVFDAGSTDEGLPYFVMEFVAGASITEYSDRGKLTTRERLELFLGVCKGVQHAHVKGIIHRDIKPSNLLVIQQDGRAIAKIIDFGVARAMTGRLADRTLQTMIGEVVGTPEYMSPEQADPTTYDLDTRSDVYSLGVVLYQLLSGMMPFETPKNGIAGLLAYQRAVLEKDPLTPSTRLRRHSATTKAPRHGTGRRSLIRQLTGDLDWICLKALEKSPARRYQSVAELGEDVRRHLAHEPVLAARPSILYRAGKFVRRNRAAVTAAVFITASAIVGVSGFVSGRLESVAAVQVARAQKPYADAFALSSLVQRADQELWPPYPEKIHDLELWIEDAEQLVLYLDSYQAELMAMEADDRQRESAEYLSRHGTLAGLVAGLLELKNGATGLLGADPEAVSPGHGWSVPRRLAFVRQLEAGFAPGGQYAEAWQSSLSKIRAAYPGIKLPLAARMGLVPIGVGPDPQSGLWEFAHLMTGEPAARGEDGKLVLTEQTGVVLVLIPGGTFSMGDPETTWTERNLHEVELSPYWLSKYEMTQGQWQRLTGGNPSCYGPGLKWDRQWLASGDEASLLHPVEQVSWWDCETWLPRCGLSLPSEAQWECGARGNTQTWFWCGDKGISLQGNANVSDAYARDHGGVGHDAPFDDLNDGATMHAPVNSYAANGFGLHNVSGNVLEWCFDGYDPNFFHLELGPNPVVPTFGDEPRVYRGGSFRHQPVTARSAQRAHYPPGMKGLALGVRPARSMTP